MRVALIAAPKRRVARRTIFLPLGGLLLFLLFLAHRAIATAPLAATSGLMPFARLFDLVLLAGALLLAHAAGSAILRVLRLTVVRVEGAAFALALGLGAGAYAALALGLVGLYRGPLLLGGVAVAAVLLRRELGRSLHLCRTLGAEGFAALRVAPRGVPIVVILVGLTIGLTLLASLTPPHHWDPLAYHLTSPLWFLRTGWVAPIPGIEFSNVPLATELLYGVGLAAGSDVFGQLLHGGYAFITALGVWGLVRRYHDRVAAWLALALFLTTPLVFIWARVADNDLTFACFTLCAVAAALRVEHGSPLSGESRRWLVLAGVFVGLALATKYQAVYIAAPLGLLIGVDHWRARGGGWRRGLGGALGVAACFGVAAALVALPWYLKNLLLFGNPIYPTVFGGRGFSPIAVSITADVLRDRVLSPRTPLGFLLLPLRAYTTGSYEQPHAILTPLFLLAPLVLLLRGCWRREVWYALIVCGGFIVGFIAGVQELRYLLTITPLLCVLVAYVLRAAWGQSRLRPPVLAILILTALVSCGLVGLFVGSDRPVAVVLGQESRDGYLRQNLAYGASHRALTFLATQLQPGERAIFMHEAQIFYQPSTLVPGEVVIPDHINLQPMLLAETYGNDPAAMLGALQGDGIGYVLINEANIRSWQKSDPRGRLTAGKAAFERLTPMLEPIYRDGTAERPSIIIYRVPPGAAR
ncbi:MAG TPA: phospholipid carrier-dependent glycosyltransferase [Thermomicrobiales bacterium]|jgi:hypothetical protein